MKPIRRTIQFDEETTQKDDQKEKAEKEAASLPRIVICHKNHPEVFLSNTETEEIKKHLKILILDCKEDLPSFERTEVQNGVILVTCSNESSVKWLQDVQKELEKKMSMELIIRKKLDHVIKVDVEYKEPPLTNFFADLKKQNKNLGADNWILFSYESSTDGNLSVFIEIANSEMEKLEKAHSKIKYGTETHTAHTVKSNLVRMRDPRRWKVVISHRDHPETSFSYGDLSKLKNEIKKGVLQTTEGCVPKFDNTEIRDGVIIMECKDVQSKQWLMDPKRKELFQFELQKNVLIREKQEYTYKFTLTDNNPVTSKEFLHVVSRKNKDLNTDSWVVYNFDLSKEGYKEVYVEMSAKAHKSLQSVHDVYYAEKKIMFVRDDYKGKQREFGYPCEFVIYHRDYPLKRLLKEDTIKMKTAFVIALKSAKEVKVPNFGGFDCIKGCLHVTVEDKDGELWLVKSVTNYDMEGLLIKKLQKNFLELILEHGGLDKPSDFLTLIKKQNDNLKVDEWRVIGFRNVKAGDIDGTIGLLIEIDDVSYSMLQGKLHISAGFDKAPVTLVTRDTEKKIKKKYGIKDD